tara:strand:- start:818 stop:1654 length:837 start_codon:yes stop_codon:yes gene_type:complete
VYQLRKWYEPLPSVFDNDALLPALQRAVREHLEADVPVGVALSGGLDSSLLMWLLRDQGQEDIHSFTFYTQEVDERPYAEQIAGPNWHPVELRCEDVPRLAEEMQYYQEEPYGGLPTLGMGLIYKAAADMGIKVVLDGQGLDEAFCGYDWHLEAENLYEAQLADIKWKKLPRSLQYNDRAAMMHGIESREPFCDHRLMEMGLGAPSEMKVQKGVGKYCVRLLCDELGIPGAWDTKRTEQAPQLTWLKGPLRDWSGVAADETSGAKAWQTASTKLLLGG